MNVHEVRKQLNRRLELMVDQGNRVTEPKNISFS